MALNNFGLGFQVTATDEASQVFNKVGGGLGKMEKDGASAAISMQEAGNELKNMGSRFSGYGDAITGALLDSANQAGVFTAAMAKAGALSHASAEQMAQMRDAAMNVDLVMKGFSFDEQAKTLAQLANETNSATAAMAMLTPALNLAKITGQDSAAAASLLKDVVSGFKLTAADSSAVVDKFAFAMKNFGLTAEDLQGAMMPTIGAAQLLGQSFDDTLTIVGIANNGLGNVKKSAMAATLAMNQLADPDTQAKILGLGVAVKDSSGHFRSMVDILGDVADKTKSMTESQKAQTLANVFGAKGAGGLNIVMDQLTTGVKTASGEILKGAAAVAELRKQMAGASGAGEELAMAGINTLPQANAALMASLASLKTAIGEPVQEMLVPIVKNIAMVSAHVAKFFADLSPGIKKTVVVIAAGIGAFMTFIGGALGAAGAVAGLIVAGKALLIGIAGVGIAVGVLVAAMAPLIAIGATLYVAWTKNIGGFQDKITSAFNTVKLAFTALYEVFSSGGFSEATWNDLNKGNEGIKAFAINAFLWFNRIKNFVMELGKSFSTGLDRVGPIIDRIGTAIQKLAAHFTSTTDSASANKDAFDKWGSMGAKVGEVLVGIVEKVALGFEKVISFVDGAVSVFMKFKPTLTAVWDAASGLFDAFGELFDAFTSGQDATSASADTWGTFGEILGMLASNILGAVVDAFHILAGVIQYVAGIVGAIQDAFHGLISEIVLGVQFVTAIFKGDWGSAWMIAQQMVETWAHTILAMFGKVIGGAAGMVDALGKMFGKDLGLKTKVESIVGAPPAGTTAVQPGPPGGNSGAGYANSPAVAQTAAGAQQNAALTSAIATSGQGKPPDINTHTTLVLDGQVVADVVKKSNQQDANRSFAPNAGPNTPTT